MARAMERKNNTYNKEREEKEKEVKDYRRVIVMPSLYKVLVEKLREMR